MSKKKFIREENMDDIVFAHRNKEYGAYELRKRYNKNVTRSLIFVFVLFIITAVTPLIMAFNSDDANRIINETIEANLLKIDNPNDNIVPPPPPPPVEVKEDQVRYTTPVVVDSVDENVEIKPVDDLIDNNKPVDPDDVYVPPVIKEDDKIVDFYKIEEKPEFPGGEEGLMKWIVENTKYPPIPKEEGITGKVFVSFIIDKEGNVSEVTLLNNVDPYLDKEALRVISSLPKWKPGKQGGESVKVSFQLPIKFMLY
jgi:protein TonB